MTPSIDTSKRPILFCASDFTSTQMGSEKGADEIKGWIDRYHPLIDKMRIGQGVLSSQLYCQQIEDWVTSQQRCRLAFGGEHLMTFPIAAALKKRYPDLRLIVFDAHHDSYLYPLATHYSHLFYIQSELKIPTQFIGVRYELSESAHAIGNISPEEILSDGWEKAVDRLKLFIGNAPFYVSVDLDAVDPSEFSGVSFPVPNGLAGGSILNILEQLLTVDPVFLDINEFNPAIEKIESSQFFERLLRLVLKWNSN